MQRLAADLLAVRAPAGSPDGGESRPVMASPEGFEAVGGLLATQATPAENEPPAWAPISAAPEPLAGRQLVVAGAVTVEIVDAEGRVLRLSPSGAEQRDIPEVGDDRLAETMVIALPAEGSYQLRIVAAEATSVDLRLRTIAADQISASAAYHRVAFASGTVGSLRLDPATTVGPLQLDDDGDGATDREAPPLAALGPAESADWAAPTSSATVRCVRARQGWCIGAATVALVGEDAGGSGVALLEYSLDGGKHFAPYTQSINVDAAQVGLVLVRAVDRAGNEQYPLTAVQVGPERMWLPAMYR